MPDVEQWLDGLGLRQYATAFVENGVDSRALPHQTERDLQAMGVLLGHRRILLAASAGLAGPDTGPADEAERRQMTVMFCDLVGSTELSTELDVEDYRELIRGFHDVCADRVARYEGFVAKFMGDGLLAYFGYPVAHDNDAERAARAALDIVAGAMRLELLPGRHPAVRIGIASGEVVVGDLVVHGVTETAAVLGATPNLIWAHAEASDHYNAALQAAAELGDERWELEVRLDLVHSLRILDRYDDALAELDRCRAFAAKAGRDEDWLRVHLLHGSILFPLGQAEACVAAQQDALARARRMADPQAEARTLSGLGDAHFTDRHVVTAEPTYDACVRLPETHGLDSVTLANLSLRGHMRLYLCRIAEARLDCERAVEMAVRLGNRRAEVTARGSCLGKVLLEGGEAARADEAFAVAGRLASEIGAHRYESLNLLFRGKVALDADARADALVCGRRAMALACQAGPRFCLPLALGVVARAEATAEACRAVLAEAEALIAAGSLAHNPLWFYRDAALAAVAHGWPDETRRYARAGCLRSGADSLVRPRRRRCRDVGGMARDCRPRAGRKRGRTGAHAGLLRLGPRLGPRFDRRLTLPMPKTSDVEPAVYRELDSVLVRQLR